MALSKVLLVLLGALFLQGCEKKEEKAKPKKEEVATVMALAEKKEAEKKEEPKKEEPKEEPKPAPFYCKFSAKIPGCGALDLEEKKEKAEPFYCKLSAKIPGCGALDLEEKKEEKEAKPFYCKLSAKIPGCGTEATALIAEQPSALPPLAGAAFCAFAALAMYASACRRRVRQPPLLG